MENQILSGRQVGCAISLLLVITNSCLSLTPNAVTIKKIDDLFFVAGGLRTKISRV